VALLPFIDEARLLAAVAPLEPTLTPEEAYRNSRRLELLFCSGSHALAPDIFEAAEAAAGAQLGDGEKEGADGLTAAALAAERPMDPEVRALGPHAEYVGGCLCGSGSGRVGGCLCGWAAR
jgi:5'-3' exonuclease